MGHFLDWVLMKRFLKNVVMILSVLKDTTMKILKKCCLQCSVQLFC